MKRLTPYVLVTALLVALWPPGPVAGEIVGAGLSGFEEVPVIATSGSGAFFARIVGDTAIDFVLVYEDLVEELLTRLISTWDRWGLTARS